MLLPALRRSWLPFHGGVLVGFITTFLILHGLLLSWPVPPPSWDPRTAHEPPGPPPPPALYGVAPSDSAVVTAPQTLQTRARHVRDSWARHCNVALFVSSEPAPQFPAVGLGGTEGRGQLYWKTIRALQFIHRQLRGRADWFLKADDDTFVVVANLRWLLAPLPPQRPLYLGKRFRPFARQGYMSGGAGYVLSRGALAQVATAFARGTCGHSGPEEDVALGQCLERLGVVVGDSRDTWGRETFHPFPPETHLTHHFAPGFWYQHYSWYPVVEVGHSPGPPASVSPCHLPAQAGAAEGAVVVALGSPQAAVPPHPPKCVAKTPLPGVFSVSPHVATVSPHVATVSP
ncbi:Glycoprotein-N-acetylgalactosamine 3-beta-galactosyltransferase 1 [Willisornis vidua]|uniref:N-acetylgalactosaminide beta-1,3-galactosyltransferase n=1 Tax=Willisornis vidua TaxID=1566151 RepID=A0ABQ9E1A6_9PASS|nr:Glycoprotein-N-acetylgalactosamine 3-beta-galactosyltransferase 1 [Willisornis vidua]